MNILDFARALNYDSREEAIRKLEYGMTHETKWGMKHKTQVKLLLLYLKQGYYNNELEFLDQMIQDQEIIESTKFRILRENIEDQYMKYPGSYWAKKLDHVIHIVDEKSVQTGGGVLCNKYGALLGNNYAPHFAGKPICLKCLLKAFKG